MRMAGTPTASSAQPHTGNYTRQRPLPLSLPAPTPAAMPTTAAKKVCVCLPGGEGGVEPSGKVLPHTPVMCVHPGGEVGWSPPVLSKELPRPACEWLSGAGAEDGFGLRSGEKKPKKRSFARRVRVGVQDLRRGMGKLVKAAKGVLVGSIA
eukprot:RCo013392